MAPFKGKKGVSVPGCSSVDLDTFGMSMAPLDGGSALVMEKPDWSLTTINLHNTYSPIPVYFDSQGSSAGMDTVIEGPRTIEFDLKWHVAVRALQSSHRDFFAFSTGPIDFLVWANAENTPLKRWEMTAVSSYLTAVQIADWHSSMDFVDLEMSITCGQTTTEVKDHIAHVTGFMSDPFASQTFNTDDRPPSKPSGPRRVIKRKGS